MATIEPLSYRTYRLGVVDAHPRVQQRLCEMLAGGPPVRPFLSLDLVTSAASDAPLVIIAGPSMAMDGSFREMTALLADRPNTAIVLAVQHASVELLQAAVSAGVADVVELPTEGERLAEAVRSAGNVLVGISPPSPPTVTELPSVATNRAAPGKILSVFSPKGGSGKSVVATNLAAALAMHSDAPVALLDADLQFGDVAVMLKMHPTYSVTEALAHIDGIDTAMFDNLFTVHEQSGMLVLPSPFDPSLADAVRSTDMHTLLNGMAREAGTVVVDTSSALNEATLAVLEQSDTVVVVVNADIASIKDVKVGLQIVRKLGFRVSDFRLVANRVSPKSKIDLRDVERSLHMKIDMVIPADDAVVQSLHRRTPVIIDSPKSSSAKALQQLAGLMAVQQTLAAV